MKCECCKNKKVKSKSKTAKRMNNEWSKEIMKMSRERGITLKQAMIDSSKSRKYLNQ